MEDTGRLTQGSLKKTIVNMAAEKSMTLAIMQAVIIAAKAPIMTIR